MEHGNWENNDFPLERKNSTVLKLRFMYFFRFQILYQIRISPKGKFDTLQKDITKNGALELDIDQLSPYV